MPTQPQAVKVYPDTVTTKQKKPPEKKPGGREITSFYQQKGKES